MLDKPTPTPIELYEWSSVGEWIEEGLGISLDNPYYEDLDDDQWDNNELDQGSDFWEWWDGHHAEIVNGNLIELDRADLPTIKEDWARRIYTAILDEFANQDGCVVIRTEW